jgi:hypothetical protein
MSSQLFAGVARCDITPPVGIAHGNWSAQVHERAEGVDLPLCCTALAVSDGMEEIILAEWELLYPPDGDWLQQIRDRITGLTGVPGSHILLKQFCRKKLAGIECSGRLAFSSASERQCSSVLRPPPP